VAITRARYKLIFIGSLHLMRTVPVLSSLAEFCEERYDCLMTMTARLQYTAIFHRTPLRLTNEHCKESINYSQ
jgi:superfamily I DNA and/or RNA helicase